MDLDFKIRLSKINNYLITGLNLSNVIPIASPTLVGSYRAWAEIDLKFDNQTNGLLNTWQTKSYNIKDIYDLLYFFISSNYFFLAKFFDENDVRYHCVCVEQTDFAPILFEDVIARIKEEGGEVGFKNGNGPTM